MGFTKKTVWDIAKQVHNDKTKYPEQIWKQKYNHTYYVILSKTGEDRCFSMYGIYRIYFNTLKKCVGKKQLYSEIDRLDRVYVVKEQAYVRKKQNDQKIINQKIYNDNRSYNYDNRKLQLNNNSKNTRDNQDYIDAQAYDQIE